MLVQLTDLQARVIGVLLEKEKTTPDQYPLTLNALTTACNQKSNREPVMDLTEVEVQQTIDELNAMNLLFEISGSGSRVLKYKHRFCNTEFNSLKFSEQQKAVICVLLLRGAQTPGELRTRTNRLTEFSSISEVELCLNSLLNHDGENIVVKLDKEPGKREQRYMHLFSGTPAQNLQNNRLEEEQTSHQTNELKQRMESLEAEVKSLKSQLDEIKTELGI